MSQYNRAEIKKYISPLTGKPCKSKPTKILSEIKRHSENSQDYRKQLRCWREQNPNYSSTYKKEHREKNRLPNKKYRKLYPEKIKAHVLSRKIPLKSHCEKCNTTENLQKHHPDYSKPLEVITLCRKCHIEAHYLG